MEWPAVGGPDYERTAGRVVRRPHSVWPGCFPLGMGFGQVSVTSVGG